MDPKQARFADQQVVFNNVGQLVLRNAMTGFNACMFAYGQTGSGKTYTMSSMMECAALDLFTAIEQHQLQREVTVSFYEVYLAKVFDLLNEREQCKVLEDGAGNVNPLGLLERPVHSAAEVVGLLHCGQAIRHTGVNAVHDQSSRSHAVLTVRLRDLDTGKECGKLALVDLAGSERGDEAAQGKSEEERQGRLEASEINKSLLALKVASRLAHRMMLEGCPSTGMHPSS